MTFTFKRLRDGSEAIRCRESGDRFILTSNPLFPNQHAVYHNGELARIGSRKLCVAEIERAVARK